MVSKNIIPLLIFSLFGFFVKAQNPNQPDTTYISETFKEYTQLPREQIFLHVNKHILFKQETIGFSAYVLNSRTKKPSKLTKNVYVDILDQNDKVIKQKLVMAMDGKAANQFYIDSLFGGGNYRLRAYTNYIRNFQENLHAEQEILILDQLKNEQIPVYKNRLEELDVQVMPEGGHILSGVSNALGIMVKDRLGYGVADITGRLITGDQVLSNFKTDQFGMARVVLIAKPDLQYRLELDVNGDLKDFELPEVKNRGILLSAKPRSEDVMVQIKTNNQSFNEFKGQKLQLFLHDGSKGFPFVFELSMPQMVLPIAFSKMSTGVNVLTLFDDQNMPISERLIFNYKDLDLGELEAPLAKVSGDSVKVVLPVKTAPSGPDAYANMSISILPAETDAYRPHHNIISHTYLKPFVRGKIQNAAYYFKDIDRKKKYQLDNLLITQGYSAYDWNKIFNGRPQIKHAFEDGLSAKLNIKGNVPRKIKIHGSKTGYEKIVEIDRDQDDVVISGFTPVGNEGLRLSKIRSTGGETKLRAKPEFSPSRFPEFDQKGSYYGVQPVPEERKKDLVKIHPFVSQGKYLEEIVIKANRDEQLKEELDKKYLGRVFMIDDRERKLYLNVGAYLSTKGYITQQVGPELNIRRMGYNGGEPIIVLNDIALRPTDYDLLTTLTLEDLEYVVVNRDGIGESRYDERDPMLGGVIRIKTRNPLNVAGKSNEFSSYFDVPLTFAEYEKFYVPEYLDYQSDFFKKYGVIDWISFPSYKQNGTLNFYYIDKGYGSVKLFVEGMDSDGRLYSSELNLELGQN